MAQERGGFIGSPGSRVNNKRLGFSGACVNQRVTFTATAHRSAGLPKSWAVTQRRWRWPGAVAFAFPTNLRLRFRGDFCRGPMVATSTQIKADGQQRRRLVAIRLSLIGSGHLSVVAKGLDAGFSSLESNVTF
jgi:hypothetical protein